MTDALVQKVQHDVSIVSRQSEVASELIAQAAKLRFRGQKSKYLLGMAAYTVHSYDAARQNLLAAYNAKPVAEIAARLAMCELRAGNHDDAVSWALKAIGDEPRGHFRTFVSENDVPYISILAAAEFSRGNIESAKKAAAAALQIDGSEDMAVQVLAMCRLLEGDLEGALEVAQQSKTVMSDMHPLAPLLQLADGALHEGIDGLPLQLSNVPMGMPMVE